MAMNFLSEPQVLLLDGKDMKKKCRLCEGTVDTSVDMTVCGYGKCIKYCLGCMHRPHWNTESEAGRYHIAHLARLESERATAAKQ